MTNVIMSSEIPPLNESSHEDLKWTAKTIPLLPQNLVIREKNFGLSLYLTPKPSPITHGLIKVSPLDFEVNEKFIGHRSLIKTYGIIEKPTQVNTFIHEMSCNRVDDPYEDEKMVDKEDLDYEYNLQNNDVKFTDEIPIFSGTRGFYEKNDDDDKYYSGNVAVKNSVEEVVEEVFEYVEKYDENEAKCKIFDLPEYGKYNRKHYPWLEFVLFKVNVDTIQALNVISKKLNKSINRFTTNGLKDKRACTAQVVRVYGLEYEDFKDLVFENVHNVIKIGNFKYKKDALYNGNHDGNMFSIVIRNVKPHINEKELNDYFYEVKYPLAFINYFGLQRFGRHKISSYQVGREMLRENWEKVIKSILFSSSDFNKTYDIFVKLFTDWDYDSCLEQLEKLQKRLFSFEYQIVEYLKYNPGDYLNCFFDVIPDTLQRLYIQGYQGYIWNQIVSERIKRHGIDPVPGDLFFPIDILSAFIHILTEDDWKFQNVTIDELCCPLPGHGLYEKDVANSIVSKISDEILKKDNLSSYSFIQFQDKYQLSMRQTFRKIFERAYDFSFEIKTYKNKDFKKPLIEDHYANFKGIKDEKIEYFEKINKFDPSLNRDNFVEEDMQAVIVKFLLNRGCYATIAMREFLKRPYNEFTYNKYFKKNKKMMKEKDVTVNSDQENK